MRIRDNLRKQRRFTEYKQARNRVRSLVRQAQKSYIDRLIQEDKSVSTLWRAISVVTGGKDKKSAVIPSDLTADRFNKHFLSVAETLAPSQTGAKPYTCSDKLIKFCRSHTADSEPFIIPCLTVFEVGKIISSMQNKKSSGPDEISPKILKLALPYTVDTLTYIYNLCIPTPSQQN